MKINAGKNKLLEIRTSPQRTLKTGASVSTINQNFGDQHKDDSIEEAIIEAEYKKAAAINILNRYIFR